MNSYIFLITVLVIVLAIIAIATFTKFKLTNEQYDRLKWVVAHWDVLVVFIGLLVKLFDMPHGLETVSLVAGIGAALGGLLNVAVKNYQEDGVTQMFNEDLLKDMVGYYDGKYEEEDEEVD